MAIFFLLFLLNYLLFFLYFASSPFQVFPLIRATLNLSIRFSIQSVKLHPYSSSTVQLCYEANGVHPAFTLLPIHLLLVGSHVNTAKNKEMFKSNKVLRHFDQSKKNGQPINERLIYVLISQHYNLLTHPWLPLVLLNTHQAVHPPSHFPSADWNTRVEQSS